MSLEASRTINLNNVSKKATVIILSKFGISEQDADNEEWKRLQEDMLLDLLNSDDRAFEDTIAVNFAESIHQAMIAKYL
ncbi:hypothetical protein LHA31_10230 [Carnobacterium viridans]|uniref:Uncharacterized protein n=1 Tax=Carnobacterium viridans TaxID=174587 RepID=A0A1H0YWC1_9LACT|nr:hypothetical protein [Carnobacterium viridans]UDE94922.1 hypothetical protein LHA31_10230 [Carnobacterium viridans]SDQ19221.1 hypothetical protein SAMN04487752_1180 [Carnobacterium viridans]